MTSNVFMFSGQGSQYYHMGAGLMESSEVFRSWMQDMDSTAYDIIGESVLNQIYSAQQDKSAPFDRTLYTAPALFMIQYSIAKVFEDKGIKPDFVMGASIGEFVAAAVSGIMSYKDVLYTLIQKTKYFEQQCSPGSMMAILGNLEIYNSYPVINENTTVASINFDSHFVVSGTIDALKKVSDFLKDKDILYMMLPVSLGFHSALIDPAASFCLDFLRKQQFMIPKIKFISCCKAEVLEEISYEYFWDVVRMPVLFNDTVKTVEKTGKHNYIDLGPSGTLANFVKYSLSPGSDSKAVAVLTPFGKNEKSLDKALNAL